MTAATAVNCYDLWLLPAAICSRLGLREFKARADVVRELGGTLRGPAPMGMGLVYYFENGVPEEWIDALNLIEFN